LNFPTDASPALSQLWHRDPEDLKLVKVFVYLADVDERAGPFRYIPQTHTFGTAVARGRRFDAKKRIADDRMARVFAPETWRVCTGPANTMILADTLGFHCGGKPTDGRRLLITFTYTSATPITERSIGIEAVPMWASAAIQRSALEPLLNRRARKRRRERTSTAPPRPA
jgi:hypothetical protein